MKNMRPMLLLTVIALSVILPLSTATMASAQPHRQALILSSVEMTYPFYARKSVESSLMNMGYNVTFLHDTEVTLDVLLNQMGNYDVVFWRTDGYSRLDHATYFFVGELNNPATLGKYAADISAGTLDNSLGVLGINSNFLRAHLGPNSLSHIRFMALITGNLGDFARTMISRGVTAVVNTYGYFAFNIVDPAMAQVFSWLAQGLTVRQAVVQLLNPFYSLLSASEINQSEFPPIWYSGDSSITIV
jgi:hypothetical protein